MVSQPKIISDDDVMLTYMLHVRHSDYWSESVMTIIGTARLLCNVSGLKNIYFPANQETDKC